MMKGQIPLFGMIIGILALVTGLVFALPALMPDAAKQAGQYYTLEKQIVATETETLAGQLGYPQLSVLGYTLGLSTLPNVPQGNCTLTFDVKNVGGGVASTITGASIDVKEVTTPAGLSQGIMSIVAPYTPPLLTLKGVTMGDISPGATATITINTLNVGVNCSGIITAGTDYMLDIGLGYYTEDGKQLMEVETIGTMAV